MGICVPSYYDKFKCIADKCKHSCCVGWEIDIDCDTLKLYENEKGDFGERLRKNIEMGETPHFRLEENDACPFLNKDNLCDIIINMGRDFLCEICREHPRFVNTVGEREEMGIGMCCEEAARIIVTYEEKVKLLGDKKTNGEAEFFALREDIFDILQQRDKNIDERILDLLLEFDISIPKLNWQKIYLGLERLDKKWTEKIIALSGERKLFEKNWDLPFEQILVYFIYRHLAGGVHDGRINERIKFAILSFYMIREIFAHSEETIEELTEICRMYSGEVEYSEENTERLLELMK